MRKLNLHIQFFIVLLSLFIASTAFGRTPQNAFKNIIYHNNAQDRSLQSLDVYSPKRGKHLPVVVFVHGGAWTIGDKANLSINSMRNFFVRNNMVFVSINYRMAPKYRFPDYPKDVATAVSFVIDNIRKYRGNPHNIYLMGHSAGAHLAALTSVDNHYLNAEHKSINAIRGTILLDGAGYDIPEMFKDKTKKLRRKMYHNAFGYNKNVWRNASPINHVKPNSGIPAFLMFYVDDREIARIQTRRFGAVLRNANVLVEVVPVANSSHRKISQSFGKRMGEKERITLAFIRRNS